MNFNTHLEHIKSAVLNALSSNKSTLVNEFVIILTNASSLLKINIFDFWFSELQNTAPSEIATTKHAVIKCRNSWNEYTPSRTTFENMLLDSCEKLFTYWQEDDLCSIQSQFHYYKDKNTNLVFKQSVLGCIECFDKAIDISADARFGIALVSDLHEVITVDDLY